MNQCSEDRVFLRRSSNHCKGPDSVASVIDRIHFHDGKIMSQTVVSEMVPERSFGQQSIGIDGPGNAEVAFGTDHGSVWLPHHPHRALRQGSGKGHLGKVVGQRHHSGDGQ